MTQDPESIDDIRRRAPLHFWARANNARMSAFVLWKADRNAIGALAEEIGYSGATGIAVSESFDREASLAMELILKANMCILTGKAPEASHDVYALWGKAKLPSLDDDDLWRLAKMTETLYWSGRYAAPLSAKKNTQNRDRLERHRRSSRKGGLNIIKPTPFGWEEFDALYGVACHQFFELHDKNHFQLEE